MKIAKRHFCKSPEFNENETEERRRFDDTRWIEFAQRIDRLRTTCLDSSTHLPLFRRMRWIIEWIATVVWTLDVCYICNLWSPLFHCVKDTVRSSVLRNFWLKPKHLSIWRRYSSLCYRSIGPLLLGPHIWVGLFGGTLPARHSVSRCALMPVFPETSWIFQLFLVLLTMRRWR